MCPTPAASAPRTPVPVMSRPPTRTWPAARDAQAGDRLDELGLAVAVDAGDADDLAGAHLRARGRARRAARGRRRPRGPRPRAAARRRWPPPSRAGTARRDRPSAWPGSPPSRPRSSTVPTFLPRRSTVTRSAISSTSRSLWEMKMTDTPSAVSARRTLNSSAVSCAVSTAVGSSRISTSAPRCSTRRISTRCCWPTPMSSTRARGSTVEPEALGQLAHPPLGRVDVEQRALARLGRRARRSRPRS